MNMSVSPNRPVVLTFVGQYLPGFKAGGPIRSIVNMVQQLGDEFDFRIVTSDRDLGEAAPYPKVEVNKWTQRGKALVFYRSPGLAGWRALFASLNGTHVNLVYLNSLFSLQSTLIPLVLRKLGRIPQAPLLIAPRGELSMGALALKPIKKRVFLALVKMVRFYGGATFQASSEHEERDIKRALKNGRTQVAINLAADMASEPELQREAAAAREVNGSVKAVFLARVSPMKNLLGALQILAQVQTPLTFEIYGVIEDEAYWARCAAAIATLPAHVKANYRRPLHPDEVMEVLSQYDFFFMPTLGENYGHVIREALSAGLPVLISDQTPWRDLGAQSAGADLPLSRPDSFVSWIEDYTRLSASARRDMRKAARSRGNDTEAAAAALDANRVMLRSAIRNEI